MILNLRKHYFQGFLSEKFHLKHDEEKANQLTGLIYMISGVLAPLIGIMLDKERHNMKTFQNSISNFKILNTAHRWGATSAWCWWQCSSPPPASSS